jgi:FKBP-type peptidyl-prolyl cis-trans isomerase SlyD
MKISRNTVVSIDYTVRDDRGTVLDSSDGQEPLTYLHGHGEIVPGLERTLEGRAAGDSFEALVPAKQGYGERDEGKVLRVPRSELPDGLEPTVGLQVFAEHPEGGHMPLWITEVEADSVTLDANHPLAGLRLHFEVAVRGVREATREEMEHGHVHGSGGHHH